MPPHGLGLSKFQERPSDAYGIQENLLAAGAPPRTRWGSLQRPRPLAGGDGLASHPRCRPFELLASALHSSPQTRNRRLGFSHICLHGEVDLIRVLYYLYDILPSVL